jgi:hypothetical protein
MDSKFRFRKRETESFQRMARTIPALGVTSRRPEPKVRRLSAGGNRIRTSGTAEDTGVVADRYAHNASRRSRKGSSDQTVACLRRLAAGVVGSAAACAFRFRPPGTGSKRAGWRRSGAIFEQSSQGLLVTISIRRRIETPGPLRDDRLGDRDHLSVELAFGHAEMRRPNLLCGSQSEKRHPLCRAARRRPSARAGLA